MIRYFLCAFAVLFCAFAVLLKHLPPVEYLRLYDGVGVAGRVGLAADGNVGCVGECAYCSSVEGGVNGEGYAAVDGHGRDSDARALHGRHGGGGAGRSAAGGAGYAIRSEIGYGGVCEDGVA